MFDSCPEKVQDKHDASEWARTQSKGILNTESFNRQVSVLTEFKLALIEASSYQNRLDEFEASVGHRDEVAAMLKMPDLRRRKRRRPVSKNMPKSVVRKRVKA
jgi:hypothetical protein